MQNAILLAIYSIRIFNAYAGQTHTRARRCHRVHVIHNVPNKIKSNRRAAAPNELLCLYHQVLQCENVRIPTLYNKYGLVCV